MHVLCILRYYYAISDIRVDGRCDCHGHAEFCDGVGMNQYCFCEHDTDGRDCEHCKPLYNNQPWKAANKTHANECQSKFTCVILNTVYTHFVFSTCT